MVSYADTLKKVFSLQKEALQWKSGPIIVCVAKSITNDAARTINLTETIGHNKRPPWDANRNDTNCHWLPSFYNQNDPEFRSNQIHPIFVKACRDAGCKVKASYHPDRLAIVFSCMRDSHYDEEKERYHNDKRDRHVKHPEVLPVLKKRKTQRPIKGVDNNDTTCTFKFTVYWDNKRNRWFLPHQQSGSIEHCGHMHVDPDLIRLRTNGALNPNEKKIAKDSLESEISSTATGNLVETRTGETLTWQQLHYLKNRDKNRLVMNSTSSVVTASDRLIAQLENDPSQSYTALYAQFDSGLLTIKTKKKNQNSAVEIEKFAEDLGDKTDNPESFAKTLRGNLRDTRSGQILLAVAWTNDKARRKFDMFPEFIGGDDTEDTNSEERPLYTILGKDSNNESFANTWCFMPSKAQWAFTWIFRHAVPILHPGTAPMRVQLVLSDADNQETRAIEGVCGGGKESQGVIKIFPNAMHRWCGWHRINRNFTNDSKYKSILAAAKNSNIFTRAEIDVFVRWLWYCVKHYEDEDEVQFSLNLMNFYLNDEDQSHRFGEIKEETKAKIREFVMKQFQPYGHKLFEADFDCMTLGNVTTGINEGEHHALKKRTDGPRPQHDIAESQRKINKIHVKKEKSKLKRAAYDATATFAKSNDRDMTATELTDYMNIQLCRECHDESPKQVGYRESDNVWYVKRDYEKHDTTHEEDLNLPAGVCQALSDQLDGDMKKMSKDEKKRLRDLKAKLLGDKRGNLPEYKSLVCQVSQYVIPRFERTRVLKIVNDASGNAELVCSCPTFKKKGHACRDMYYLLGGRCPKATDARVRWHIGYNLFYGRENQVSEYYQYIRDKIEPTMEGIPLTEDEVKQIKSLHAVGAGDKEESYFTRSLNKLYLRGKNNYWQKSANKFEREVFQCFGDLNIDTAVTENNETENQVKFTFPTKKCSGAAAAPLIGASRQVQGRSQYMVPSQSEPDVDFAELLDCGEDCEEYTRTIPSQGKDSHNDFHHLYETCAKLANANKGAGREKFCVGLNRIKEELMNIGHCRTISLPQGPIGINLGVMNGCCFVTSPKVAVSNPPQTALMIGDEIISLNGIKLNEVEGGITAWAKLFVAFANSERKLIIRRNSGEETPDSSGMDSMPKTSSKKIPKRMRKATSPGR